MISIELSEKIIWALSMVVLLFGVASLSFFILVVVSFAKDLLGLDDYDDD